MLFAQSNGPFFDMGTNTLTRQLYLTAVRVEASNQHETNMGTAFLVRDDRQPTTTNSPSDLYLVTNTHLVTNLNTGTVTFTPQLNGKPLLGQTYKCIVNNWNTEWFCNPVTNIDVAVLPLAHLHTFTFTGPLLPSADPSKPTLVANISAQTEIFLTPENAKLFDGSEEAVFIGYPANFYDTNNFLPVLRHAYTASPLDVDFMGERTFVIDAAVFPGSSGSPVFVYNSPGYMGPSGWTLGARIFLAGILARYEYVNQQGQLSISEVPSAWTGTFTTAQPFNIGIVFKAETILDTIDAYKKSHATSQPTTQQLSHP
jgi:hypothetical protein